MFFNREELKNKHKEIYFEANFAEIDFHSINFLKLTKNVSVKYDGFNLIKNNIYHMLVNNFSKYQPLTYQYLTKGEFFYAIDRNPIPVIGDSTKFGIIINNMAYYISYDPYSYSIKETIGHYYIPIELLNSWFFYSENWSSVETYTSVEKTNLPSLLLRPLHTLIKGFEDESGKSLPKYTEFLEEKFKHLFRQSYQDEVFNNKKYFELRCLLDTRANDDWSESGFQLFVSSHNNERNVYVIQNADVFSIKQLINPAEAIDHYAAHIFSINEDEFDFMIYAKDF